MAASHNLPVRDTVLLRLQFFYQRIRPYWWQFFLLAIQSGLVGAVYAVTDFTQALMAGPNRNSIWQVSSYTVSTLFLVTYGVVKACSNLTVGLLADRFGRRTLHIVGWSVGFALPLMVIFSKNWATVVGANVFLGAQQGLAWSSAIFMLVDYGTRRNAGISVGVSETFGYSFQALFVLIAGYMVSDVTKNYRHDPYYLVLGLLGLGWLIAVFLLRDTTELAKEESLQYEAAEQQQAAAVASWGALKAVEDGHQSAAQQTIPEAKAARPDNPLRTFVRTSFLNRSTVVICIAGLMTNFMTGFAWGLFIKWMKAGNPPHWAKFSNRDASQVLLGYALIKGLSQFLTGLLSDLTGRKWIVVTGLWTCTAALTLLSVSGTYVTSYAHAYGMFMFGAVVLGWGTGLMYPNLLAAISDHTPPRGRPAALGTYRFWRDMGYAIGGLLNGVLRDATGSFGKTVGIIAAFAFAAGVLVAALYREQLPPPQLPSQSTELPYSPQPQQQQKHAVRSEP